MSITATQLSYYGIRIFPYFDTIEPNLLNIHGVEESYHANIIFYINHNTDETYLIIKLDTPSSGNSGSCTLQINGLPENYEVVFKNNPIGTLNQQPTSLTANFSWTNNTDDMIIIKGVGDTGSLNIVASNTVSLNGFNICSSNESNIRQSFTDSNSININIDIVTIQSNIAIEPPPSIYDNPVKSRVLVSPSTVSESIYSSDGTTPSIAKYLAYDDLVPPTPFIAVVEDGKGNVLFDGGFPKWYNSNWNSNWQSFDDLDSTYKYLYNAINYITNQQKRSQGNNNILIIGDANTAANYSVKSEAGSGFNTSFTNICQMLGLNPTFRTPSDYSGGMIDTRFNEYNNYIAVIFMSSVHTSGRLITNNSVNDILTFREQGNGLLIVTDHGAILNSLEEARNNVYTGFFRTANYVATELGCYFSGDVNRNPVNVGFLRSNYGEHPLWDNVSNDDFIYAGGSEGIVVVPEVPTTPSTEKLPLIDITTTGYTPINILYRNSNGNIVTETYTYGLSVPEIVFIKDNENNNVLSFGSTNYRNIDFDFDINSGMPLSGFMKINSSIIGEFEYNGSNLRKTYYTYDQNSPFIKNGDSIVIEVTEPFNYTKTVPIIRNSNDVLSTVNYTRRISYINRNDWDSGVSDLSAMKSALSGINVPFYFEDHERMSSLHKYMTDKLRLPPINALIYDDLDDYNNATQNTTPPSTSDIFNEWGVFVTSSPSAFYDNLSLAPNISPFNTWIYDTNNDRIVQTANTSMYTGFVSKEKLEYYEHEVTLTSSNNDDDAIGVVMAHVWDGAINNTLSVVATMGGVGFSGALINIIYNYRTTGQLLLAQRFHDATSPNSQGGDGWSGKSIRVKVIRNGNMFRVLASNVNSTEYNPLSEMTVDLNHAAFLDIFKGAQSYGYSTYSQANSTYLDIALKGGTNTNVASNTVNGGTTVYDGIQWKNVGITLQEVYGFPRVIYNNDTGQYFFSTQERMYSYWGSEDTIEVIGSRVLTDNSTNFNILNYDENKTYTTEISGYQGDEPFLLSATISVGGFIRTVKWISEFGLYIGSESSGSPLLYSIDGIYWTEPNIVGSGIRCWDFVYSPTLGLAVAVGANGTILTSTDGINWIERAPTTQGTDNIHFRSVTWSEQLGMFVAVASSSPSTKVMYSTDGINWSQPFVSAEINSISWHSVIWVDALSKFIAVGSRLGQLHIIRVMYSDNGLDWYQPPLSEEVNDMAWYSIAWSPELGVMVAVGAGVGVTRVRYSYDGITWSIPQNIPFPVGWEKVIWVPHYGVFVAVGRGQGVCVMYSTDGINWTLSNSTITSPWWGVTFNDHTNELLFYYSTIIQSGAQAGQRVSTYSKSIEDIIYPIVNYFNLPNIIVSGYDSATTGTEINLTVSDGTNTVDCKLVKK